MAFLKRHWPWIFLLLIPLLPLWKAVFAGEAIGPFDQIRQFAPWNGPKPTDAWDVLQADGVLQFYVWRDLVFESWRNFQVPFWNPYQLAGTPLLANSQSGALYPPHILMGILHVPTPLAIALLAWFHLFWAGLGVSKLVKSLGGSEIGGVVAAASFALSPFMLSWTALSSVITTVAWIPWMLWALVVMFGLPEAGQTFNQFLETAMLRRRTQWRATWILAICLAMSIFGGHLQFVAYGGMAVVLMSLGLSWVRWQEMKRLALEAGKNKFEARRALPIEGSIIVALVLGGLLATPQLLPVLKHSETSHRRNVASEAGYQDYLGNSLKPFEFANLVSAKALGDPRSAVDASETLSVAEYWPPLAKNGGNFAESAVTIGPLVLGLLFLVPWRDRRTWPLAGIGVLALLLAMGTALNKLLYFGLPGWSSTGSPGRITVLFILAACVLAGLGVRETALRRCGVAAVGVVIATALTIFVLPSLAPAWLGGGEELGKAVKAIADSGMMPQLLIALVFGASIFLLGNNLKPKEEKGQVDPKNLIVAIPVLLALVGYANLIPTGKPLAKVDGPANPHERVAIVNENWGIVAADKNALMPPNLSALSRIHELAGYDSLLNSDTKRILDEINGQDSAPPANGNIMFIKSKPDWETLVDAGVSEVWSKRPLEIGNFPMSEKDGVFRYRLKSDDKDVSRTSDNGKITSEGLGRIGIEAEGPKPLYLAERNLPGWSATVDGKPVPIKDTAPGGEGLAKSMFMSIDLPAGKHQVELSFVSPGYSMGLMLGIPAWLLALFGLAYTHRTNRTDLTDQAIVQ